MLKIDGVFSRPHPSVANRAAVSRNRQPATSCFRPLLISDDGDRAVEFAMQLQRFALDVRMAHRWAANFVRPPSERGVTITEAE